MNDNDKTNTDGSDVRNGRRKGALRPVLYMALLAAGIFAALQVHEYINNANDGRAVPGKTFAPNLSTGNNPIFSTSRPAGAASMPAGHLAGPKGIRDIDADPGNIAPPDEAERIVALEIPSATGVSQQGSYIWFGTVDEAAEHYKAAVAAAGYNFVSDQETGDARRLIFMQGTNRAVLFLRESGGGRINIELTVIR